MVGKLIRHLDENDLIAILADYFGVDKKAVNLIPFLRCAGYGMDEHEEPAIRAEVNINTAN